MVKKSKFWTITAMVATIAAIASMGSIGGIGLGQQQIALATVIGEDEADLGDIEDAVRDIIANIVSDNDDDPDPEKELCSRPGELFIPRELGGPKCIDTNFTMNPLPDFP
jgi:hypothetical protein